MDDGTLGMMKKVKTKTKIETVDERLLISEMGTQREITPLILEGLSEKIILPFYT